MGWKEAVHPREVQPKGRTGKELEIRDGLLHRGSMLWAPKGVRKQICESEHDTKVAGHMGQDKTIELIRRNFWWPKMNEGIIEFVRSCPEC